MRRQYLPFLQAISIVFLMLCGIALKMNAYPFVNISTAEGLSNRHVSAMTIDNKGYYWFATHSGIDKFNGHDFFHYKLHASENNTYEEQPLGILKNKRGNILAYSGRHVYQYSNQTDSYQRINQLKIPNGWEIIVVKTDDNDRLLIGTRKGLLIYNSKNQLITKTCLNLAVYDLTIYDKSTFYVATSRGIRKLICPQGGSFSEQMPNQFQAIANKRIQSIYCDVQTKTLWAGTFDGLLYTFANQTNASPILQRTFQRPIRSIVPIDTDRIWVGIDGQGIFVYNRFTLTSIEEFSRTKDATHQFAHSNGVYSICEDKNLVWICTFSSGIFIYDKSMLVKTVFTEDELDGEAQVNCIHEDKKGRLWFGTNNGIMRYTPSTRTWKRFALSVMGGGSVLTLKEDRKGNMWVGGFMCNVRYIDSSDHIVSPTTNDGKSLPQHVYTIYEDQQGNLYFGGIIHGMTRYNPITHTTTTYPIRGIYQIESFKPGHLLLATTKGLILFNTYTGKKEKFPHISNNAIVFNTPVTCFRFNRSNKNILWVGTKSQGLAYINLHTGSVRMLGLADGISSTTICGMEYDQNNRLWVSTEDGLNCISNDGNITALYKSDGLPDGTMEFRSNCLLASGDIAWGTPTGAFVLNPDHFRYRQETTNLHLENFLLFGNCMKPGQSESPLTSILDNMKELHLSYRQNNFCITFYNVGLQHGRSSSYTYYLEGLDHTWCSPTNATTAHYMNLSPGKYIFHVKVSNHGSKGKIAERTLVIYIAQPWYNTFWAWMLYILIISAMFYLLYRLYRRWMSVRDSDQKVRFFVNLAHDLRTPLTLIKAPLQEIDTQNFSADDRSALNLAKKNTDRLLNMVNQLLDFQKIEREAMSLTVEETKIGTFLRDLACNFAPLAQSRNITLKLEGNDFTGYIDRKKINVIVDNLLSNAIKYTETGGNVMMEWKNIGENLVINIIDDGIGIPKANQKDLFSRFYRADNAAQTSVTGSGIGLLLTKEMAHLHKGDVTLVSEQGVGSSFTVTVPISKQKYSKHEILANTVMTGHENCDNNIEKLGKDTRPL